MGGVSDDERETLIKAKTTKPESEKTRSSWSSRTLNILLLGLISVLIAILLVQPPDSQFQTNIDAAKQEIRVMRDAFEKEKKEFFEENPTLKQKYDETHDPYIFPGRKKNWLEELVPEELIPHYKDTFDNHNYTANFMRSTRSTVGNLERLRIFLRKVQAGICTTTMVFGGSVSWGHNGGGLTSAYHYQFLRWLNAKYPCKDSGKHRMLDPKGPQTSSVVDGFPGVVEKMRETQIDMVFVEFGANDPFGAGKLIDRMDRPNQRIGTVQESLEWITEILVRRLLSLRITKPAIVYVELSMHYRSWPWTDDWDTNGWHFMEYAHMGAWGHYPVQSYYGIPTINTIDAAMSLWMSRGPEGVHNGYFAGGDACCHPQHFFHQITGLALAYNFQKEMDWMSKDLVSGEHDFTLDDPPVLRPGWRVTKADDEKYVTGYLKKLSTRTILNFLDKKPDPKYIGANSGWKFYSDSKNKTGMIAIEEKSHISFKIKVDNSSVILGFLTTYENISPVNVWFDDYANVKDGDACLEKEANLEKPNFFVVDPLGTDKVSVYASRAFDSVPNGDQYIHVCLVPNDPCKFKILKLIF